MADPILVKLLAETALQAAKDKESRNRLLAIILGPVISLLLLVALVVYLATSPLSALTRWMEGDEVAAVDEFQKDYGYNNDSGIFERDFREADGQEYDEDVLLGREGETQVVYYNQLDERWADEPYGQDKIGTHGCGPTTRLASCGCPRSAPHRDSTRCSGGACPAVLFDFLRRHGGTAVRRFPCGR